MWIPEVNGTYNLVGDNSRGFPEYHKRGKWKGGEVEFIIEEDGSEFFWQWFITIGYDIHLYTSETIMRIPPLHDWYTMEEGIDPAPTLRYKTADDSVKVKKGNKLITIVPMSIPNGHPNMTPDEILVEGCGIAELTGTYQLSSGRGPPVFSKKGIWQGKEVYFDISHGPRYWTISTIGPGWHFSFYRSNINNGWEWEALPPPVNGWVVMSSGVDPAPTLKYIYEATSSSVSDSIKVQNEDSAKVKEEEYGRETDGEEDKEIAAVPTPVVSSQLKKSVYDEDTDDDISPDPVKSSQVKVKDEIEEDTDDDTAPDQVQSTYVNKVKEELEESTDEEGIAPKKVKSSQIKVKTEQAEEDTDEEDIIPDFVQSTKVKEEGEDTDADTDVNDESIETLQYVVPNQILIDGRGILDKSSSINGIYTQVARLSKANAPVFSKRGVWKGKAVDFVICRKKNDTGWFICRWKGDVTQSGTCIKKRLYTLSFTRKIF